MADVMKTWNNKIAPPVHRRGVGHPFGFVIEKGPVVAPVPDDRATRPDLRAESLSRRNGPQPIAQPVPRIYDQVFEHKSREAKYLEIKEVWQAERYPAADCSKGRTYLLDR